MLEAIKAKIRDIPDFPVPGIVFKDITPLLSDHGTFNAAIGMLSQRYMDHQIDYVIGIEARGFVLGAPLATALQAGFVMVRKPGKLPSTTLRATYQLEYGEDTLEIHKDAMMPGSRVLLVDDVLATGGTMSAAVELVQALHCNVVELVFLIELSFLSGRERLQPYNLYALIQY